jgi:hypothetical protein
MCGALARSTGSLEPVSLRATIQDLPLDLAQTQAVKYRARCELVAHDCKSVLAVDGQSASLDDAQRLSLGSEMQT